MARLEIPTDDITMYEKKNVNNFIKCSLEIAVGVKNINASTKPNKCARGERHSHKNTDHTL